MSDSEYDFIRILGKGSHGSTWKAVKKSNHQNVAIKIFGDLPWDKDTIEDWEWERKMMGALLEKCHPYAVCVIDAYIEDGLPRLVMDLVNGPSVFDLIVKNDLETRPHKWNLVKDLIKGIKIIHKHGLVHEDIKSENLIYDNQLKIFRYIDFGLSCLAGTRKAAYNKKSQTSNLAKVGFPCSTYGTKYTSSPILSKYTSIKPKKNRPIVPWALLQSHDYWQIGLEILRYYTFEFKEDYYLDAYRLWSGTEPSVQFIEETNLDSNHPFYFQLPKEFVQSEIKKIDDLKVRTVLWLLLDFDDFKRVENFELVVKIVKGKYKKLFL